MKDVKVSQPEENTGPGTGRLSLELTSEPQVADPPRYRRLKIACAATAIVLALLTGVRMWWGYEAQRRMDALIATAHARGERILPEDFVFDSPSDDQNAAVALQAAGKAIVQTPAQEQWANDFFMYYAATPKDVAMMQTIVSANTKALAEARRARGLKAVNWGIHLRSPVANTLLRYLNDQRPLSELLLLAARFEHESGNDAAAVEHVRDQLRLCDACEQSCPVLVTHSFASWDITDASERVAQMASSLDVNPGPPPRPSPGIPGEGVRRTATTRPASFAQVEALIGDLLDESSFNRNFVDAWMGERMMYLDMDYVIARQSRREEIEWVVKPLNAFNAIRRAHYNEQQTAAAREVTFARAMARARPNEDLSARSELEGLVRPVLMTREVFEPHYRALAARRAAGVMLALRLYQLEHDGKLPRRLEELTPGYLHQLPVDPFRADGGRFVYRADASPPVVYSIGPDGIDDGGAGEWPARLRQEDKDIAFRFAKPPTTKPSGGQ